MIYKWHQNNDVCIEPFSRCLINGDHGRCFLKHHVYTTVFPSSIHLCGFFEAEICSARGKLSGLIEDSQTQTKFSKCKFARIGAYGNSAHIQLLQKCDSSSCPYGCVCKKRWTLVHSDDCSVMETIVEGPFDIIRLGVTFRYEMKESSLEPIVMAKISLNGHLIWMELSKMLAVIPANNVPPILHPHANKIVSFSPLTESMSTCLFTNSLRDTILSSPQIATFTQFCLSKIESQCSSSQKRQRKADKSLTSKVGSSHEEQSIAGLPSKHSSFYKKWNSLLHLKGYCNTTSSNKKAHPGTVWSAQQLNAFNLRDKYHDHINRNNKAFTRKVAKKIDKTSKGRISGNYIAERSFLDSPYCSLTGTDFLEIRQTSTVGIKKTSERTKNVTKVVDSSLLLSKLKPSEGQSNTGSFRMIPYLTDTKEVDLKFRTLRNNFFSRTLPTSFKNVTTNAMLSFSTSPLMHNFHPYQQYDFEHKQFTSKCIASNDQLQPFDQLNKKKKHLQKDPFLFETLRGRSNFQENIHRNVLCFSHTDFNHFKAESLRDFFCKVKNEHKSEMENNFDNETVSSILKTTSKETLCQQTNNFNHPVKGYVSDSFISEMSSESFDD